MKEQVYKIISIAALVAYYIPILIVLFKKLWKDLPILLFSFYWLGGGLINLVHFIKVIPEPTRALLSVIYNLLDVPFVLMILYFNTNVQSMKKISRAIIPVYLFIEIMNGIIRGFTRESFKYFVGIGVLIIIIIVICEIFYFFQNMDSDDREKAKVFLYFALLFEYATYIIYYIVEYYYGVYSPQRKSDNEVIYDLSTLLGILIACFGFLSNNLRRKLPVQQTVRPHEVLINIID